MEMSLLVYYFGGLIGGKSFEQTNQPWICRAFRCKEEFHFDTVCEL